MRLAPAVLMVRPARFGFNAEAARSNVFARADDAAPDVAERARAEVERAADTLRAAGVRVFLAEDTREPPKPDAAFPNNWVSVDPDGTGVLYPMAVASRRPERRIELVDGLPPPFRPRRWVDLSPLEATGAFLEGTGSLVLDHAAHVGYAARSPRTTEAGITAFEAATGYRILRFDAALDGAPVYHTNVVLALGPGVAVVATELVGRGGAALAAALAGAEGGEPREVLSISAAQVRGYAGNLLFLEGEGGPLVVGSRRAWEALGPDLGARLARAGRRVTLEVDTLESVGGGSARCLLAELYPHAG